ncbi:MAG: helix-turn-helix transcriptional regulator [Bacilli bacterium]|nr:helix-turn-helix transcriptional regulator [Bacilli bacterium]
MNSEKLQNLILEAIERKKISQRELAKLTGISRSTLNDIVNGKIKKIKLDDLYQISIPLELNLEDLLDACGFNNVLKSLNRDRYEGMSTRQLKEKLDEYQQSELNLLSWDAQKRKTTSSARNKLFVITNKIEMSKNSDMKYTKDDISKDVKEAFDELESVEKKYDYSKLPKKP